MTLRAPAVVPPIRVPRAPVRMGTPAPLLRRAALPAALVPMRLPATTLPVVPAPWIETPSWALPEMTLPPILLPLAPAVMDTPAAPGTKAELGRGAEPAA